MTRYEDNLKDRELSKNRNFNLKNRSIKSGKRLSKIQKPQNILNFNPLEKQIVADLEQEIDTKIETKVAKLNNLFFYISEIKTTIRFLLKN